MLCWMRSPCHTLGHGEKQEKAICLPNIEKNHGKSAGVHGTSHADFVRDIEVKPKYMLISANFKAARVARRPSDGFTLVEVMIAFVIFGMVTAGILYGYVEANRVAEWSSMSLGAQSYASQGVERARAAKWDTQANNEVTADLLPVPLNPGYTNWSETDTNDVPQSGAPLVITNVITISNVSTNSPFLRQIRSDVIWRFPLTGQFFTNTIITLRAPDQ